MKTATKALDCYRSESGEHLGIPYRKEWLSIGPRGVKGHAIVHVDGSDAKDAVDTWGRHLCAAVNACAGIATEALEQGVVCELVEALAAVLPYAENEAASLQECCKRDRDAALQEEADACTRVLDRAWAVLARTTQPAAQRRPA
jgi:hypothetical protein